MKQGVLIFIFLSLQFCQGKEPLQPGVAPVIIKSGQNSTKIKIQLPVLLNFGEFYL